MVIASSGQTQETKRERMRKTERWTGRKEVERNERNKLESLREISCAMTLSRSRATAKPIRVASQTRLWYTNVANSQVNNPFSEDLREDFQRDLFVQVHDAGIRLIFRSKYLAKDVENDSAITKIRFRDLEEIYVHYRNKKSRKERPKENRFGYENHQHL